MEVRDLDGTLIDPLELLKKYGINAARLRIWHTPANVPYSRGYCDLAHTISMAKRVRDAGMEFMLDFHYSDFWADPGHQDRPKAWEGLSFEELEAHMYSYTRETLLSLQAEGVLPGIVQIGNEIRSGLLFPDGELPDYTHMVRLVNAGIAGARSVVGKEKMRIMIHLDQGGRYFYLKEWLEKSFAHGLSEFDVLGLSYYPFWHGTFHDLKETMTRLIEEYQLPVMIVETAHPWRRSSKGFVDEAQVKIAGFPATPAGQRTVLALLRNILASLPDGMGQGMYYWEPLCVPEDRGGWSENMGLLDESGRVMEGILGYVDPLVEHADEKPVKGYAPEIVMSEAELQKVMMSVAAAPESETCFHNNIPEEVPVLMWNGSVENRRVTWLKLCEKASVSSGIRSEDDSHFAGNDGKSSSDRFVVEGIVEGMSGWVEAPVRIETDILTEKNYLTDADWEQGLAYWKVCCSDQVFSQIVPESVRPFPAPPVNTLRVEGKRNFSFEISQTVSGLGEGTYTFQVQMRGTDTTNVDVRLFAQNGKERVEQLVHLTEHEWRLCQLGEMRVVESGKKEQLTVGVTIHASPMYAEMKDMRLIRSDLS